MRGDCPNVEGVKWRRVFAHARALSGFCVQDLVETVVDGGEVFQNWNLGDAFRIVSVDVNRVVFSSGAVHGAMLWAEAPKRILVYAGEEAPLVGWRSTFEGELHEVATISARLGCRKAGDVVKTTTVFAMAPTLKEAKALRITNADYASETTRVTLARGGADVNLFWRVAPGNYEVKCA